MPERDPNQLMVPHLAGAYISQKFGKISAQISAKTTSGENTTGKGPPPSPPPSLREEGRREKGPKRGLAWLGPPLSPSLPKRRREKKMGWFGWGPLSFLAGLAGAPSLFWGQRRGEGVYGVCLKRGGEGVRGPNPP